MTAVAENPSVRVAVWPGLRVAGAVIPVALNAEPETETAEMVTGAVPVELIVTDWVVLCPVCTLPKLTLALLALSVGVVGTVVVVGLSRILHVSDPALVDAVSIAVSAVGTTAAVAMNVALVACAGTVTV